MSRLRLAAVAATFSCALMLLGGAGAASAAQTAPRLAKTVAVTGASKSGKKFTGKYTIDRFVAKGRKTSGGGTPPGRRGGKRVTKQAVKMPFPPPAGAQSAQLPPIPGACQILNL